MNIADLSTSGPCSTTQAQTTTGPETTHSPSFWGKWSNWSKCSRTCAGGQMRRTRTCNYNPLFDECLGKTEETKQCNPHACPHTTEYSTTSTTMTTPSPSQWGMWSAWSTCSRTCGGGKSVRTRKCDYNVFNEACYGRDNQSKVCNRAQCIHSTTSTSTTTNIPAQWNQWSDWSTCSRTCGGGMSFRKRTCNQMGGYSSCPGQDQQKRECNRRQCTTTETSTMTTSTLGPATWTPWGHWSSCSTSCGEGQQVRKRTCKKINWMQEDCIGKWKQNRACNVHNYCTTTTSTTTTTTLPTAQWMPWGAWSSCSEICGSGVRTRKRNCQKYNSDQFCPGKPKQTATCNRQPCTTTVTTTMMTSPAMWSKWSRWTQCSKTCDQGVRTRQRKCNPSSTGNASCFGPKTQRQTCAWRVCTTTAPSTTATVTYPLSQWNKWTAWTTCTRTCGGGITLRYRKCKANEIGDACYGFAKQQRNCNMRQCIATTTGTSTTTTTPVPNEQWSDWSRWNGCSKSCGFGINQRYRQCESAHYKPCTGKPRQTKRCHETVCTTTTQTTTTVAPSTWMRWTKWTQCTASCNGGMSYRKRVCSVNSNGDSCYGPKNQKRACNRRPCPTTTSTTTTSTIFIPDWANWSRWAQCSVTCGGGKQWRKRICLTYTGGPQCSGQSKESQWCNQEPCTTTTTTTLTTEMPPPRFGSWTPWTPCTVSCGGGVRTRRRKCKKESFHSVGDKCYGQSNQSQQCNRAICITTTQPPTTTPQIPPSKWGWWSPWSTCSQSCGYGQKNRSRKCILNVNKDKCVGKKSQSAQCYVVPVCTTTSTTTTTTTVQPAAWAPWSAWTDCTKSCNGGRQTRKYYFK